MSIYDGSLLNPDEKIAFHQLPGVNEIQSTTYPLVVYRESNHEGNLDGNIKFIKFGLEVVNIENRSVLKNEIFMKKISFTCWLHNNCHIDFFFPFREFVFSIVIARAFQGLSGAIVGVLSFALVADSTSPEKMGEFMAFLSSSFTWGMIMGPVLGGILSVILSN